MLDVRTLILSNSFFSITKSQVATKMARPSWRFQLKTFKVKNQYFFWWCPIGINGDFAEKSILESFKFWSSNFEVQTLKLNFLKLSMFPTKGFVKSAWHYQTGKQRSWSKQEIWRELLLEYTEVRQPSKGTFRSSKSEETSNFEALSTWSLRFDAFYLMLSIGGPRFEVFNLKIFERKSNALKFGQTFVIHRRSSWDRARDFELL